MSLDLTCLKLLKYRDRYQKLAKSVPKRALDTRTQIIFDDFGAFFEEFPDCQVIDPDPFMLWFQGFRHPTLKPEAAEVFKQLMVQVSKDVEPALEAGLMRRLAEGAAAYDLTTVISQFQEGAEIDVRRAVQTIVDTYDTTVVRQTAKDPQVRDDIADILAESANNVGLQWPLPCMNRHIRPLIGGDMVIIAARPDRGKTTFAAQMATHMAPFVDKLYPGENRSILWFNNEGPGRRIVQRCFQSALGVTLEEMNRYNNTIASTTAMRERYATLLREKYAEALGGRPGVLRIFNVHGMSNYEIEDLISKYKPALCIWDMIDNVRFGGRAAGGGERTDQVLEGMYNWVRDTGVRHDCAMVAMSQISAAGDGLQFPTLPMLKDSQTGKQGACDLIVTIGAVNDPVLAHARYIGVTKSKLTRTGMASSPMTQVRLDGDRARYVEE